MAYARRACGSSVAVSRGVPCAIARLLQARVMQSDRDWDAALWHNLVPLSAAISEIMRAALRSVIRSWVSSNLPGPGRRSFIPARLVVS